MTDSDREAFETLAEENDLDITKRPGQEHLPYPYYNVKTNMALDFWQAARDHYAPKLTEKDAEHICNGAIIPGALHTIDGIIRVCITALRAAGLRFKEEA